MPLRIRLKRVGTTKRLQWRVVIADSKSPRDGKFIANIGYYDPNHNPAIIKIDETKFKTWVTKGALPSVTVLNLVKRQKKRKS